MDFKETDVFSADASMMIEELNKVLEGILGHNGTMHVNLADFSQEGSAFFVGYENNLPVCCAGVRRFDETTGEVKRVYARKNTSGYAAKLMNHLEVWAAAAGYSKLILECREKNEHAIEFYKREGYAVIPPYTPYENEEDAVCLEKRIGS